MGATPPPASAPPVQECRPPAPSEVPGPLPLLGLAAAGVTARELRRRLRAAG